MKMNQASNDITKIQVWGYPISTLFHMFFVTRFRTFEQSDFLSLSPHFRALLEPFGRPLAPKGLQNEGGVQRTTVSRTCRPLGSPWAPTWGHIGPRTPPDHDFGRFFVDFGPRKRCISIVPRRFVYAGASLPTREKTSQQTSEQKKTSR